jgi:transcription initiation factor TFIIIB Brf1 subunit/transcription initiation factor TFIIB
MATPVVHECPQCRSQAVVRALSVEGYGYCVSCGWVFPTSDSPHEPRCQHVHTRRLPQIDRSLLARG